MPDYGSEEEEYGEEEEGKQEDVAKIAKNTLGTTIGELD